MPLPAATFAALAAAGRGFTWLGGRTFADFTNELADDVQESVLTAFVLDLKANARKFPARNSGIVPTDTTQLRQSLRIRGINGRRPTLMGAEHGIYVQRHYGPIWTTAWRNYGRSERYRRAVSRARSR